MQYIVDSMDASTETLFVGYREARGGIQSQVAQMYTAIVRAETTYAEFDAAMGVGGALEALGEYHAAMQLPIDDAVALMRVKMTELAALVVQMQAGYSTAVPGGVLFPGVPTE